MLCSTAPLGDAASISLLAAVKDAEDHEPVVCEAVLKHVGGIEDLQHELAIFLSPCNGASESGKLGQYLCSIDDCTGGGRRQIGMMFLKECGKALEIMERVLLDLYCPRHGL